MPDSNNSEISLFSTQNFYSIIRDFAEIKKGSNKIINIKVEHNAFFQPCGVAALANLYMQMYREGYTINFIGNHDILNYLSRIDFFSKLGIPYTENFRRHNNDNFVPVMLIENEEDVKQTCNSLCEFLLNQIPDAGIILEPFEWCINEIIDNIRNHSQSKIPGIVCGQYYPSSNELLIAIVDSGIGIKQSLSEGHDGIQSHEDAIRLALQRGITRNPQFGQGNGLAGTKEIIALNRGQLHIWSSNSCFSTFQNRRERFMSIPDYKGTGVLLKFNTKNGISFSDTFIGSPAFSYIEYLTDIAESEIGIDITEFCTHTRGRSTARKLRKRIEFLLPNASDSIKINFSKVGSVSSSFLDELLGKLVKNMGLDTFNRKIRIIGADQQLINMANVVIEQRLNP